MQGSTTSIIIGRRKRRENGRALSTAVIYCLCFLLSVVQPFLLLPQSLYDHCVQQQQQQVQNNNDSNVKTIGKMKATNNNIDDDDKNNINEQQRQQPLQEKQQELKQPPLVDLQQGHNLLEKKQKVLYKSSLSSSSSSKSSDYEVFQYGTNPTVFGNILRGELETKFLVETTNVIAFEDISPRARLHGLVIPKLLIPSVFDLLKQQQDKDEDEEAQDKNTETTKQEKVGMVANSNHTATTSSSSRAENYNKHNKYYHNNLMVLQEMKLTAERLVKEYEPVAHKNNDYILCFHVPPFNSVDHLHLHVLAPVSKMSALYRYGKYNTGYHTTNNKNSINKLYNVRWTASLQDVMSSLENSSVSSSSSSPTPYQKHDDWKTIMIDTITSIRSILSHCFFK